jgi:hypothetical protein
VGENLDEGLGFEVEAESDGGGDRRIRGGLVGDDDSVSQAGSACQRVSAERAYRFGRVLLAGWAGFGA